jgi:transposase
MTKISTIGLDLAKRVIQVHGVDEHGTVIVERRLRRSEAVKYFARLAPALVGMETARPRTIGRASCGRSHTGCG